MFLCPYLSSRSYLAAEKPLPWPEQTTRQAKTNIPMPGCYLALARDLIVLRNESQKLQCPIWGALRLGLIHQPKWQAFELLLLYANALKDA